MRRLSWPCCMFIISWFPTGCNFIRNGKLHLKNDQLGFNVLTVLHKPVSYKKNLWPRCCYTTSIYTLLSHKNRNKKLISVAGSLFLKEVWESHCLSSRYPVGGDGIHTYTSSKFELITRWEKILQKIFFKKSETFTVLSNESPTFICWDQLQMTYGKSTSYPLFIMSECSVLNTFSLSVTGI